MGFEGGDEAGVAEGGDGHESAADEIGEGTEVFLEPGAALGDEAVIVLFFFGSHGAGLCGL